MLIRFPLKYVFNPAAMVLMTAFMSALAWSIPAFGVLRKGYQVQADASPAGLVVLAAWYLCIAFSFYIGQKGGAAGSSFVKVDMSLFGMDRPKYLYIYTLVTAVGLSFTYYKILTELSLAKVFFYLTNHQANMLKESLYDNYSAGVMSLRYLIVFSAPLAFRRWRKSGKLSLILIINVLLLLLVSLLSSRLLAVATLLNIAFISSYHKDQIRVKFLKPLVVLLIFFSVMSVFNFTRNGDYYEERDLSFWGAGISEMVTYLGSPFQVSLGAANTMGMATNVPSETYREYIDIEEELNSNSAFVFLHEAIGFLAWPYILLLGCVMGFLFRFLAGKGSTVFMLTSGAILYASAELWRLDLFQQGVFLTWFVCSIFLPLLANVYHFFARLTGLRHA